jgi:hypothetical protein
MAGQYKILALNSVKKVMSDIMATYVGDIVFCEDGEQLECLMLGRLSSYIVHVSTTGWPSFA